MALGLPGSDTALSIAADPTKLIPMATAAGVLVTIGAVVWTYEAYTHYEEKKHRKEIEAVNAIHKRFLERVPIPENREIQGFPPIFKLTQNEKSSSADSMHFTDAEVEDIGNTTTQGLDIALTKYRELILNAILKLKEYYLDRKERHDVTAGVLSYLMYMLEKKFLNFEGYEYDIAYLHAFSKFISEYMSMEGTEKSQHFQRLDLVRAYLLEAKQELEKHQKALSLEGMIAELNSRSVNTSKKLIRTFVQLTTPKEDWKYVKTATFDELSNDVLRKKYTNKRLGGLVIWSDKKIEISQSNFRDWMEWLLMYFEESINIDSPMTVDDVISPASLFALPDLQRRAQIKKKSFKRKKELDELQSLDDQLKSIRSVFARCNNFVTVKLDQKTANDTPKFINISEEAEVIDRSKVLVSFATLIHQTISLEYLCVYLLKSVKQLGEIYMKNPSHFVKIFEVLDGICNQIKQSIAVNKDEITEILKANLNKGRLAAEEILIEETQDLLDSTHTTISRLGKKIQDYRDAAVGNDEMDDAEIESVKHEMFEVANKLANIYNLKNANPNNKPTTPPIIVSDPSNTQPSYTNLQRMRMLGARLAPKPPRTFWQTHRFKILGGILIATAVLSMLVAAAISIFSAGALSAISAIAIGAGFKIGMAGLALMGVDALFGFACGLVVGGVADGVIAASVGINTAMTTNSINVTLQKNNRRSAPTVVRKASNASDKPAASSKNQPAQPRRQPAPNPQPVVDGSVRHTSRVG